MNAKSPLTNGENVTLLKSFSREKVVEDWKQSFDIDISSELESCSEFYLYRCNDTGLRFFYPKKVTGSALLYEKLMNFDWYYMSDKWEYKLALRDLRNRKKILEIGCGHGHFVCSATENGFQIEGIDSNEKAVADAQKKGLNVYLLSAQDLLSKGEPLYDCLCSFQVLEHLANPMSFLLTCMDLLTANGLLLLSVPNINSFLKYEDNLLDMPPHHMSQWSIHSFRSLEKILPIKVEAFSFEPLAEYHIPGYLQAKRNQFRAILSWLPSLLSDSILERYEKALRQGLNKHTRGQSLYIKFRKKR
ncbi:MAG: methyltransferase domain-containing protein [Nodosilinea sp.]